MCRTAVDKLVKRIAPMVFHNCLKHIFFMRSAVWYWLSSRVLGGCWRTHKELYRDTENWLTLTNTEEIAHHALVEFDKDDTSWSVMSCISSHADHLRGCFSRKLEGVKHPISRWNGNCAFLVEEGAHFNKENRSNIRFDVS